MRKRFPGALVIMVSTALAVTLPILTGGGGGPDAAHPARTGVSVLRHGTVVGQRASQAPPPGPPPKHTAVDPGVTRARWTGTWAASPQRPVLLGSFRNVTLRLIVHVTIGGGAARIRLSNEFGTVPLQIGAATVGVQARGAAVRPGTLRRLTFNGGWTGDTVRPGAQATSDGVPEKVPAGANLAVSLYLPAYTGPATKHADAGRSHQTSYISAPGDHADAPGALEYPLPVDQWYYLDGVDVDAPGASAVVTLGDSITDGTASTNNADHRYPDWLADRLRAAGGPYAKLSVLNEGLGGNELLRTSICCGASPSALDRLNTDVLDQPGVKDVIVLLGTNDIFRAHHATASAVIAGLKKLITRIHARHLRVFGGTIPPSSLFSPSINQVREEVNHWIRTSRAFDGVEDFSRAVADPRDPARLRPRYDSGGHLHPDDAGYRAMANAVYLPGLLGNRS
ncbi:MAG: SGNH/GDSL hydrolase family protein [Streptosporangiales bacterium]|nr:SGNH/GDSL hydrolase family protein [Streptosporangiales bacterium]